MSTSKVRRTISSLFASVVVALTLSLCLQDNLNNCGVGKRVSVQRGSLQTRALTVSEPVAATELKVTEIKEELTELESYVLDFDLGFTAKMQNIVAYFAKSPTRSAVRLAEVNETAEF